MKTYKNVKFKRDYDCMNVKFIQTNELPDATIWAECDEQELLESNCTHLSSVEGQGIIKKFFGYM